MQQVFDEEGRSIYLDDHLRQDSGGRGGLGRRLTALCFASL